MNTRSYQVMAGAVVINSYHVILERISSALTEKNGKVVTVVALAVILSCHGIGRFYYGKTSLLSV